MYSLLYVCNAALLAVNDNLSIPPKANCIALFQTPWESPQPEEECHQCRNARTSSCEHHDGTPRLFIRHSHPISSTKPPLIIHALLCSGESLLNLTPVDNIPDCIHIVGADIPVVHIISMLPHINSKKRYKTGSCMERILVGTGCWFKTPYEMNRCYKHIRYMESLCQIEKVAKPTNKMA